MFSEFCSPWGMAFVLLKNDSKFQLLDFGSSIAGGGSSIIFSFFGETEGGVEGPLVGGGLVSSSESSLLSEPESDPVSDVELALPELCIAWPEGLGGLWCTLGLGEPLDCRGLTGGGETTCSGVICLGGDGGLLGLSGLVGDKGPTGDGPIGDMGASGGGAGVIAGIDKLCANQCLRSIV